MDPIVKNRADRQVALSHLQPAIDGEQLGRVSSSILFDQALRRHQLQQEQTTQLQSGRSTAGVNRDQAPKEAVRQFAQQLWDSLSHPAAVASAHSSVTAARDINGNGQIEPLEMLHHLVEEALTESGKR